MAKLRFPGKALKLNLRKRIKFRNDYEVNPEEIRALQIKKGLLLFRNVFGESDEEDEYDFDGFGVQNGNGKIKHKKQLKQSRTTDVPLSSKKEGIAESPPLIPPPKPMCEKTNDISLKTNKEFPIIDLTIGGGNDHTSDTKSQSNNNGQISLIDKLNKEKKAKLLSRFHLSRKNVSTMQLKKLRLQNNALLARGAHITRKSILKKKLKRKFILPSVSARSSRVIIPNRRLFSDITAICSTTRQTELENAKTLEVENRRQLRPKKDPPTNTNFNGEEVLEEKDQVCRSITRYTDSITEKYRGQVGRPPKRIFRRTEADPNEDSSFPHDTFSPSKEDRVKEKIEKLLRSPWDNRLKPAKKERDDEDIPVGITSAKNILRKARLNLNKKTLQKIRSPSSVQRLMPVHEEDSSEVKCNICKSSESIVRRYGASCCSACSTTITNSIDGPLRNLECTGSLGECQLVGLTSEERCLACWLGRILLLCTVPSLLHDRLRKKLPSILKDKVPSSLGRSNNIHSMSSLEVESSGQLKRHLSTDSGSVFGSVIDLPGGWKRRTGPEVTVISPSGEKFKSITKLEDYLKHRGFATEPSALFGFPSVNTFQAPDIKMGAGLNHKAQVVVTTLPGGWSRRIKWRHSGKRFDIYVCSPDGRTFRSRKELSAYFLQIGKVDDIHKYFPLKTYNSSCSNSSDQSETSSVEPSSSSEICSELSADERTPDVPSETETRIHLNKQNEKLGLSSRLKDLDSHEQENDTESHVVDSVNSSQLSKKSTGKIVISNLSSTVELPKVPDELSLPPNSPQADSSYLSENKTENNSFESGRITLLSFCDSSALNEDECCGGDNTEYVRLSFKDCLARKFLSREESVLQSKHSEKSLKKHKKKRRKHLPLEDSKNLNSSERHDREPSETLKSSTENLRRSSRFKPVTDDKKEVLESTDEKSLLLPKSGDKDESEVPLICDVDKLVKSVKESLDEFPSPNESIFLGNFNKFPATATCEINNSGKNDDKDTTCTEPLSPSESTKPSVDEKLAHNQVEEEHVEKKAVRAPFRRKKFKRKTSKDSSIVKAKIPNRARKVSSFTKESFGNNWSRKIRWSENGEGKVAFLTSPEGQRIVSTIELLAYFKKAGRPIHNLDYYFPSTFVRPSTDENSTKTNSHSAAQNTSGPISSQENADNLARESIQELVSNSERVKRQKRLKSHFLIKRSHQEVLLKRKLNKMKVMKGHSDKSVPNAAIGGPRVKHVCRSQAQVLGMPRAIFPSPEKCFTDEPKLFDEEEGKLNSNSSKLPKKTLWCGKCPGCTTPNCQRCSNCLNMKKFGGPGTKKKPCILRKCTNPTLSLKSGTIKTFIPRKPKPQLTKDSLEALAPEIINCGPRLMQDYDLDEDSLDDEENESYMEGENEEFTLHDTGGSELSKETCDDHWDKESDIYNLERAVFVPRQMYKIADGKDQRSDIQIGKELTPGARVNIDYWQGYDAEEMLLCGFPIITSNLMDLGSYCFRCGSRGKERLFFCAFCCEGIHPFCMEEGEGPESELEESFWICRRCIVCHVCGGSGHDTLMQCSSCRMHYHIECLGPSSHTACQSTAQETWLCVACSKCSSCGNSNVVEWLDVPTEVEAELELRSPISDTGASVTTSSKPFCSRCIQLRESKNFCPLCTGCYEDDDFDSKMMECGRCMEWIHARCEGISDEYYQVLSFLPDSVEYICKLCLKGESAFWLEAVNKEMLFGMETVLEALMSSKSSRHLMPKLQLLMNKGYLSSQNASKSAIVQQPKFVVQPRLQSINDSAKIPDHQSNEASVDVNSKVSDSDNPSAKIENSILLGSTECKKFEQDMGGPLSTWTKCDTEMEDLKSSPSTREHSTTSSRPLTRSISGQNVKQLSIENAKMKNCSVRLLDIYRPAKLDEAIFSNISHYESCINIGLKDSTLSSDRSIIPNEAKELSKEPTNSVTPTEGLGSPKSSPSQEIITPSMKISKDIDDDCISSEESSFCESDTEIESIIDECEDPKDFYEIKSRLKEHKYQSLLQYHVDVLRLLENGKAINRTQSRSCRATYLKHFKEHFPWFDIKYINIFSLIDKYRPFPAPFDDHNYFVLKAPERSASALSCHYFLSQSKRESSPQKAEGIIIDYRKCVLCNINGDDEPDKSGRLLYLGQDEWIHVNCSLWSSEVYEEEDGGLQNVYLAVSRGKQIKCSFCQERGATIGCCQRACQIAYHFLCARKVKCIFVEDKRVFCSHHGITSENGSKTDDFKVSRSVYINMDSERKRWKKVFTNKVHIVIGSLTIENLGRIFPNLDSPEALIPADFVCSRMYWSTVDPSKMVKYVCQTKYVFPSKDKNVPSDLTFSRTIDHTASEEIVQREMDIVKNWMKRLENKQLEKQTRETNIIPPHLCPLYRNILKEQRLQSARECKVALLSATQVDNDIKACLEDLVQRVHRSTEEENLLLDAELPGIVSPDDNEIISMVLRDLPACDSSLFQSTPSTSGRQSPLDLDFLAACDQTIDVAQVLSQDPQTMPSEIVGCGNSSYQGETSNNDTSALLYQNFLDVCDVQMQKHIADFTAQVAASCANSYTSSNATSSELGNYAHITGTQPFIPTASSSTNEHYSNLSVSNVGLNDTSVDFPPPGILSNYFTPEMNSVSSTQHMNHDYRMGELCPLRSGEFDNNSISANCVQNQIVLPSGVIPYPEPSTSDIHDANYSNYNPTPVNSYCSTVQNKDVSCKSSVSFNDPAFGNYAMQEASNSFNLHEPIEEKEMKYNTQLNSVSSSDLCKGAVGTKEKNTTPSSSSERHDKPKGATKRSCESDNSSFSEQSNLSECRNEKTLNTALFSGEHLSSAFSSKSSASTSKGTSKKQVCRVLPMLSSNSSRRSSSASDQSDVGNSSQTMEPIPSQPPREPLNSSNQVNHQENINQQISNDTEDKGKEKICMKRNYKTVIKKYPLRSGFRKNKPYETVQIEINETIEMPGQSDKVCKSVKRKWSGILDSDEDYSSSPSKEGRDKGGESVCSNEHDHGRRSHRVLKFSDDRSDITVSIINKDRMCNFSSRKKRNRYCHKTVLQLDGAVDDSSSEMSDGIDDGVHHSKGKDSLAHSDLALHIKQQSLARSAPGDEGPYKCSKCKRLYRTKDSYNKHSQSCNFEVDSSSSTSEEDDRLSIIPASAENPKDYLENVPPSNSSSATKNIPSSVSFIIQHNYSGKSASNSVNLHKCEAKDDLKVSSKQKISQKISDFHTSLDKLKEMCSSSLLKESPEFISGNSAPEGPKKETPDASGRTSGVHRQIRNAISRKADVVEKSETKVNPNPGSNGADVFIPPTVSPMKFVSSVKKTASPRRYTNVRLMRGSQGYHCRRAHSQLLNNSHQSQTQISSGLQIQREQQVMPVTIQPVIDTSTFGVQASSFPSPSPQYHNPLQHSISHGGDFASARQITSVGQFATAVESPQVLTVLSGPTVAVPQGYTLQYVGSYRDGDICAPTNMLTYPSTSVLMPSSLVVAPQPPVVVPQVMNTNIAYTITAPETLVLNQPGVVPNVQYISQQAQVSVPTLNSFDTHPQQQMLQQPLVQAANFQQLGAMVQYSHKISTVEQPSNALSVPVSTSITIPKTEHLLQLGTISTVHNNPHSSIVSSEASILTNLCATRDLLVSTSLSNNDLYKPKPKACIAPQLQQMPPQLLQEPNPMKIELSQTYSRPVLSQNVTARSVATVAPAIFSSTNTVSTAKESSSTCFTSSDNLPIAAIKPRPTYSYRDAMRDRPMDCKQQQQEIVKLVENNESPEPEKMPAPVCTQTSETEVQKGQQESESVLDCEDKSSKSKEKTDLHSFKLILRKENSSSTKFNILPIKGPNITLPSPEVKELRIKAKVSVGPKRKKYRNREPNRDLIIASRDTTNDLMVNEQLPNFSLNLNNNVNPSEDPNLFQKPKTSPEPYIVFELTSEDGFKVESKHISEVWQKVFDAVSEARESLKLGGNLPNAGEATKRGNISGLDMLGLTHNAVQYLLEQLPGSKDCHRYSFQFHRRPKEEEIIKENLSGCARAEAFKLRSPYDVFSWLASKHRKLPQRARILYDEIQLSTRRATSLELPMAMRYRHLCETAREAVGVFRSNIHGRGLFCKRDIDSGEMVIEYAGQVIRSNLCDMREKYYESRGIGCYMFRIDDETVIDATMHGNAARFINHSCDPNCYSRVVDILGKKHIIIFALRRILRGEELTYDYKFPIEEDKIPCSCGARRCRKYLN